MKTYELVNCWPHLRPHNFEGRPFDMDCPEDGEIFVKESEASKRIAELESQVVAFARQKILDGRRIAELEAAIDKLAQCKGRFHTEANFKALIEVRNKSLHK